MNGSRLACPSCRRLQVDEEPSCWHCAQPLAWVRAHGEVRDALTEGKNPRWWTEIRIEVDWEGGRTSVGRAESGSFELQTASGEGLVCRIDQDLARLSIQQSDKTESIDIPGELALSDAGANVSVWLEAVTQEDPSPSIEFSPPAITFGGPGTGKPLAASVGSHPRCDWTVDHIERFHFALVVERGDDGTPRHWIVDIGSSCGTYVNRQPVIAHRLRDVDLIQAGPVAWTFYEDKSLLEPAHKLPGAKLGLQGVAIPKRLQPVTLDIEAGEMVALAGLSGSGKTTILRAILQDPGEKIEGRILVNGQQVPPSSTWLGYVAQDSVLHGDLSGEDVVSFNTRLRQHGVNVGRVPAKVVTVLRQVALAQDRWKARPGELSGGQRKRLQVAAELVAEPQLLLMDEPTSGLDPERESELLQLVRSISHRGCTVLVATHALKCLGLFDRVVLVGKGTDGEGCVLFNGPPDQLRQAVPSGRLEELSLKKFIESRIDEATTMGSRNAKPENPRVTPSSTRAGSLWSTLRCRAGQCGLLLSREWSRLWNRRFARMLPSVGVPLLFAFAIHTAVPAEKLDWLGFFCLLTSIWLGASLGLLAIADEREIVDHERLLFLRVAPYIAAKTVTLWYLSLIQTVFFFGSLWILRSLTENPYDFLHGPVRAWLALALVGVAATGLGLVISAFVRRNRQLAAAILPLVMMVQILFNAQIAGEGQGSAGSSLHTAYRHLHAHGCDGTVRVDGKVTPCPLYAEPQGQDGDGGGGFRWLCDRCAVHGTSGEPRQCDPQAEIDEQAEDRPHLAAVLMSYATLSRYGDIILRSFAYSQADAEAREGSSAQRYNYASCRGWAVVVLLGFAVGLPALSGLLLGLQGTRMWKHATEFIAAQPGSWSRMWKTFSDRPPRRQANRNAKPQSLLDHASQRHGQA